MNKPIYACDGQVKELCNPFTKVVNLDTMFNQDGQSQDKI